MSPISQLKKICLIIGLIIHSTLAVAQNFFPFNESVTKRFYNSTSATDNSYFFFADSVHYPSSGKRIFYQYRSIKMPSSAITNSGCGFFGSAASFIADTTWLGTDFTFDSISQHLSLKNRSGETLDFDFSLQAGDSSLFYQNASSKYYIKAGSVQNEMIYSVNDAVKSFTVLHFSNSGQIISSQLHGQSIKLSQHNGLTSFIDVFHFPAVEKRLLLQGQLNPLIGTYQMRFEDLYPFHIGDSMQYTGNSSIACSYITTYNVASRQETANSVTITFKSTFANTGTAPMGCPVYDAYPALMTFPKNTDILGFPYNRLADKSRPLTTFWYNGQDFETRTETVGSASCGNRMQYVAKALAAQYCSKCTCIGPLDAHTMSLPTVVHAYGIGINNLSIEAFSSGGAPDTRRLDLAYSSIGGKVCGTYTAVGISHYEMKTFSLFPNPANNDLNIPEALDELIITASDGSEIQTIHQPASTISIAALPSGLYIIQLKKGNFTGYSRIIKL